MATAPRVCHAALRGAESASGLSLRAPLEGLGQELVCNAFVFIMLLCALRAGHPGAYAEGAAGGGALVSILVCKPLARGGMQDRLGAWATAAGRMSEGQGAGWGSPAATEGPYSKVKFRVACAPGHLGNR